MSTYKHRLKWSIVKPGRELCAMAGGHMLNIYSAAGNYSIVIDDDESLLAYSLESAIETAESEALLSFKEATAALEKE